MIPNTTSLERAFELAKSGRCQTIEDLYRALKDEGYSTDQIAGPWLMRQLRDLMRRASPPPGWAPRQRPDSKVSA